MDSSVTKYSLPPGPPPAHGGRKPIQKTDSVAGERSKLGRGHFTRTIEDSLPPAPSHVPRSLGFTWGPVLPSHEAKPSNALPVGDRKLLFRQNHNTFSLPHALLPKVTFGRGTPASPE